MLTVYHVRQSRYNPKEFTTDIPMKRNTHYIIFLIIISLLTSCSFNPFNPSATKETGSPVGAAVGGIVGGTGVGVLGGSKFMIGVGALTGGVIGYYVTTLRYDSGGILQVGGKVYQVGDMIGIYIPSDYLFEPNSDDFYPQARPILDSVIAVLKRYPANNILISGNTSGFYRARWEQDISERRAQKVAAYLWHEGINNFIGNTLNMRQLNYVGYGDYFPLSSTLTNKGIRENSRIQIISYPNNCDLGIDKRHVAVHNIAGLDSDDNIADAPAGCLKGEC